MTGAEAIVAQLAVQGVGSVFAVAGASHSYLLDALDQAGFAIVSSRHESGAVGAADGYARALGNLDPPRVGVAMIVSEQGLANAVGGLAVAHALGSPVLLLVAAPPRGHAEADASLDHDQLALVTPVSKWARTVPDAGRLADYVATAIRHAVSGRPGPVVLLLPQDIFLAEAGNGLPRAIVPPVTLPAPEAIDAAAAVLAASVRPLVIAGAGAWRGGAAPALNQLATEFGIPVLGNGSGRGLVAEDNRLGFAWPYAQIAAHLADCVVVVGETLTQRLAFGLPPRFAADVRIIQVDSIAESFDRNRPVEVALQGRPGPTLDALIAALRGSTVAAKLPWLESAVAARGESVAGLAARSGPVIHPLALASALQQRLAPDTMIVGDGADIQNWMYGALRVQRHGGFADHYPLGAMGAGTAIAVGAATALAERARELNIARPTTLLVTGDGSIGFHPAELHAAALSGLDLKIIVGNDSAWGTEAHGQELALGRTINTELGLLPYARLAEAFGCTGLTCDTLDMLGASLDTLLATQGPALLDVRIDKRAGAELKRNPLVNMIRFSDIAEAQSAFTGGSTNDE